MNILNRALKIIRTELIGSNPWEKACYNLVYSYPGDCTYVNGKLTVKSLELDIPKDHHIYILKLFTTLSGFSKDYRVKFHFEEEKLVATYGDLRFNLRGEMDIYTFREVILQKSYNYIFHEDRQYVVFDIGMNTGMASCFFCKCSCC
jgi:hypothetical protein